MKPAHHTNTWNWGLFQFGQELLASGYLGTSVEFFVVHNIRACGLGFQALDPMGDSFLFKP